MEDSPRIDHSIMTIAVNMAAVVVTSSETPELPPATRPITHDHPHGHNSLATATNYPHDHRRRCILLKTATAEALHHVEMALETVRGKTREKAAGQVTKTHTSLPIKLTADVRSRETVIEIEIGIENGVVSISGGTIDITICHRIARDGSMVLRTIVKVAVEVGMMTGTGARMGEVGMMSGIESGMDEMAETAETDEMAETEEAMVVVVEDYITMNEEVAVKAHSSIVQRGVEVLRGETGIENEMGTARERGIEDEAELCPPGVVKYTSPAAEIRLICYSKCLRLTRKAGLDRLQLRKSKSIRKAIDETGITTMAREENRGEVR